MSGREKPVILELKNSKNESIVLNAVTTLVKVLSRILKESLLENPKDP